MTPNTLNSAMCSPWPMWVCNCVHMTSSFSFSNLLQFKSGRVKPQASLSLGFCHFTSVFYSSLPFHITPPSPPKQIIIFIISFSSSTSLPLQKRRDFWGIYRWERAREKHMRITQTEDNQQKGSLFFEGNVVWLEDPFLDHFQLFNDLYL